jgi:hypothetical protein
LNGIDLENMKESLMNSEYLKELNLRDNKFVDDDCLILNEILKKSKIERINLACKQFLKSKIMGFLELD